MDPVVLLSSLPEKEASSGVSFLYQTSVKDTFPSHTHRFFELFFVLKGKAIHHINGEREILSQGDLVFIRPEDVHYYSFVDHYDMELLSLGIDSDLIERSCAFIDIPLEAFVTPAFPRRIHYADQDYWPVAQMLLLIRTKALGEERRKYMLSLLPILLCTFQFDTPVYSDPMPDWLSRLIDKMEKPENFTAGLPRMIELSGVAQEHMNRVFKRFLGMTPTAYINLKRINYGADLLCQGNTDIIDICFHSGFNSVSSFYHAFRKAYHCSPREFLRSRAGNPSEL